MGIQLFAWFFEPSYNAQLNRGYLANSSTTKYTVSTTDFLPAVFIYGNTNDPNYENWELNNLDEWEIKFYQIKDGGSGDDSFTVIDPIDCTELIDTFT